MTTASRGGAANRISSTYSVAPLLFDSRAFVCYD